MNKSTLLVAFLCSAFGFSNAQISQQGTPYSFEHQLKTQETNVVKIDAYPLEKQLQDIEDEKNGTMYKMGAYLPVNKTNKNAGKTYQLESGAQVWSMTIQSDDALALGVTYDQFELAPGAKLYLYNKTKSHVIGAFTQYNNPVNGIFANELVQGDQVTLELYEPANVAGQSIISVNEVLYAYRDVHFLDQYKDFGDGEACMINANCSEGDNWRDEQRGVARILVRAGSGAGWCSGSLINNTALDCAPYFLTAAHCADGADEGDLNQWIFYFNYEASGCTNPSSQGSLASQTIIGCELKTGNSTGDYYLVLLNKSPLAEWNAHYNGFDASGTGSSSGVSIHHPGGDIKKISTYSSSLSSSSWTGAPNTHWRVYWSATTNGQSVTQGGSSGSPIFNANGEIVGMLTGGSSYCSSPNAPDLYGKMSYGWNAMKAYLDPINSGVTSIDGSDAPCANQALYEIELVEITSPDGTICGTTVSPKIDVKNNGYETITSFDIEYTIDGTTYNATYSGSLTAGSTTTVTLDNVTISSDGDYTMDASISNPNGQTDEDTSNDDASINFSVNADGEKIRLRIRKDNNGSEITWDVRDLDGNIIQSGGPYNDGNMAWESELICVDQGCFVLNMYDSGNDGICCGDGSGRYEMQSPDGSVVLTMGDGQYGSGESKNFCYQTGVSHFENATIFNVFPVPAQNEINVNISMTEQTSSSIYIVNALGQVVYELNEINGADIQKSIGIQNLETGIYSMVLQNDLGKITRTFTIMK